MKSIESIVCKIYPVIALILAIGCIVFWKQANTERTKLQELCKTSAASALQFFKEYSTSKKDYLYTYAVSEFRSFMTAYLHLNDNKTNAEYTWCNTIYGEMVLNPKNVQANTTYLIDALEYLSKNYNDLNGYRIISEVKNRLLHDN